MSNKSLKKSKRAARARKQKKYVLPLLLTLGGLLLILTAFLVFRRGEPALRDAIEVTGAPSLKTDKERIDLGDIRLDQLASVTFQLTNVGDQVLHFTEQPWIEVAEGC